MFSSALIEVKPAFAGAAIVICRLAAHVGLME